MLKYDTDTGKLTIIAKDTGDFVFSLDNYQLNTGDTVYFTVNNVLEATPPAIQKSITTFENGKAIIHLSSADTNIAVGDYYYDIEVDTADGRVDTVVGPLRFRVSGGVKF